MKKFYQDEVGGLALEWVFMFVILVIGIVGGMAAIRNSIIEEGGDLGNAVVSLKDNYTVQAPPTLTVNSKQTATINGFNH